MDRSVSAGLSLGDYLDVIARRGWVMLISVVLVGGVATAASWLQTPVYESEARVLLQPRSAESLFDTGGGLVVNDRERAIQTEIDVIESQPVRTEVSKKLGFAPALSVQPVAQRDVIRLIAKSVDARAAAVAANVYATEYIKFKRTQAVDDLLGAGEQIQTKIRELESRIAALPAGDGRSALVAQQSLFREKLDQLQVDAALKTGGAQMLQPATASDAPVSPRPLRSGILGLGGGIILGVGAAFVLELVDDAIHDKDDLAASSALPVLGLIPSVADWKDRGETKVVTRTSHGSSEAEAYRSLRTAVHYLNLDRPLQSLQVTSPTSGEGKTTTAANLAVALANTGQQVVLVDCDLRRPRIHRFFNIAEGPGFTAAVIGDIELIDAVQGVPGVENLRVITSGERPPNPSELLSSTLAAKLFFELRSDDVVVIIDSPPVLPVTDARVLAGMVDGTLLVVNRKSTSKREMARAIELLEQVDGRLVGTVLNEALPEPGYGYYYTYGSHDAKATNGRFAGLRRASRSSR